MDEFEKKQNKMEKTKRVNCVSVWSKVLLVLFPVFDRVPPFISEILEEIKANLEPGTEIIEEKGH